MEDKFSNDHRGFGFITYRDQAAFDEVQKKTHELGGSTLSIRVARARTKKFFVGGLARDVTTTDSMRAYFEAFGQIEDIFVLADRGFGFVTLYDHGDNLKPVEEKQWHTIDGKNCEVKLARPREMNTGPRGGNYRGGYGNRGGYQQQYGGYGQQS